MSNAHRIARPETCPYTRGEKIQFQFEGKRIEAYEREPLAMALLAAGVRVFGRSIKYHRPRAATCLSNHCTACMMRVDGVPNVRTCDTTSRSGQVVERQMGWPGAGRDVFRIMDWFYGQRLDHHSLFTSTGSLNRMAMRMVRKMSGFGQPPTADPPRPNPIRQLSAKAVVIGAGVAGLQAAMALAEAGHQVIQLEHGDKIGGLMLDCSCRVDTGDGQLIPGWQAREQTRDRFDKLRGIELHQLTPVVAVYPGTQRPCILASNDNETMAIEAERLVVTTGAWGQIPLFENNDLPGIFSLRGLDKLICGWGVVPAEPVLVAGESDQALQLALELAEVGVKLAGVLTQRDKGPAIEALKKRNIERIKGLRILRARGGRWLNRVELARLDADEPEVVLDCGALAAEAPPAPAYELAHHAGCRVRFSSQAGYTVGCDHNGRTSDGHIFAAGLCAGAADASQAWLGGQRAGLACALSIEDDPAVRKRLEALPDPVKSETGTARP